VDKEAEDNFLIQNKWPRSCHLSAALDHPWVFWWEFVALPDPKNDLHLFVFRDQ
jgi:hypothetical protein